MRVCKLGDGLAIPLPPDVVAALHLAEGDTVDISASGPTSATLERKPDLAETIAKLRNLRRPLPLGYVFNREEANER